MVALYGISFISLALALFTLADPHGHAHGRRHQDIAPRVKGDMQLHKRYSRTRWTFYDVGLGACGKWSASSDFIVALNSAQFGRGFPGPNCLKTITMTYNGKSAQATIMDECPGCTFGALDLSEGLFRYFASEDEGVIYGDWYFNDGSSGGNDKAISKPKTTTTKQQTKTTQPPPPPPQPTNTRRKTSTTKQEEATTTSLRSTSSTLSTSTSSSSIPSSSAGSSSVLPSVNYTSGVASGLAVPTGVVQSTPENPQVINNLSRAVIYAGGLIAACAEKN